LYLTPQGQKESLVTETDIAGMYRFSADSGTYTLRVEDKEHGVANAGPFAVVKGGVTRIDLLLKPRETPQAQFFDEPQFTVAGVTDNTYRGGHGSDTVLRSTEELAKATASLGIKAADSNAAEPHHALGETNERAGHPLEAVKEFQLAAELNPSERNVFDWGTELLSHRAPQAAAEVFTKGYRLFPESVRMLLGMGTACYGQGSYREAARWFFRAADLVPDDPTPYSFLNQVEVLEITESEGYRKRMARFARLQPGNALANYYYAVSLWKGRAENAAVVEEVQALLEKAVALDAHLGRAYLQLGIVYAAEQKYREAVRAYQKAVDEEPGLPEAHYRLSEAYRITGDRLKAEQELSTYHQLSKESAEEVERERREVRQFVIALRKANPPQ
jgi:tetratricopeptide (TPR) repeat protein